MSTCNRLDLGTLGSHPIMPKIFPNHWSVVVVDCLIGHILAFGELANVHKVNVLNG